MILDCPGMIYLFTPSSTDSVKMAKTNIQAVLPNLPNGYIHLIAAALKGLRDWWKEGCSISGYLK